MKINVEEQLRQHVRSLLSEGNATPVSMETGSSLFNSFKDPAVSGDVTKLKAAVKEAIKIMKSGDRADQKFADNLRAFQASIRAHGRADWRIAELAFAEWRNRRRMNPGIAPVSESISKARTCRQCGKNIVVNDDGSLKFHDDPSGNRCLGGGSKNINEGTVKDLRHLKALFDRYVENGVEPDIAKRHLLGTPVGQRLSSTIGLSDATFDHALKLAEGKQITQIKKLNEMIPFLMPHAGKKKCERCGQEVQLNDDGTIKPHGLKDSKHTCSGSGTKMLESKTELETIYERLHEIARRDNTKVFELLDRMMIRSEREENDGPTSGNEMVNVVPSEALPVQVGPLGACDNCGSEPGTNIDCRICVPDENPGKPTSGAEMTQQPLDVWGFMHSGRNVTNPLVDAEGNDCDPYATYGDSFINSRFPFEFNGTIIIDPRYDETGELEVDPMEHYGNAFESSDYARLLRKKQI